MTNPIHDRIGGKYYHHGSTRYWFYGFALIILLIWLFSLLDTPTTKPIFYAVLSLSLASNAVIGIVAMIAAPFASNVISQMRRHEAYELIGTTTLTRQQILQGLLSGILTRFRRGVGFYLFALSAGYCIGVLALLLTSKMLGIMMMPVLGMLGLCYLGLLGGVASGLLFKDALGANVLALSTHFVVVSIWFLINFYLVDVWSAFLNANSYYQREAQNVLGLTLFITIAPFILTMIPLTISYFVIRRT